MATSVIDKEGSHSRQAMWALALALGGVLAYVMYSYLGTFVLGLFVYYITRPVHRRLSRQVSTSSLAAVISLLTIALPILLIIGYAVAVGVSQLGNLVGPQQIDQLLGPLLGGVSTGAASEPGGKRLRIVDRLRDDRVRRPGAATGTGTDTPEKRAE